VAASTARGLAFSGVSVAAPLGDGIGRAVHAGALEVEAESIAVSGAGLGTGCPPRLRRLSERVAARGCVVSELPCGAPARRWGVLGAARVLAALAQVTLVVEAGASPRELAAARVAQALGRRVAAVPGRVTSHTSAGPNQLLHEGAALVRGASDVLELLYAGDPAGPARCERRPVRLAPRLLATLRAVSSGRDTIQQLLGSGTMELEELLGRLSELELAGLLTRTSTGRYLPRAPD
jgi:DNA processing protein